MRKLISVIGLCSIVLGLGACAKTCETEPIVEQNHKLVIPKNFGNQPKN